MNKHKPMIRALLFAALLSLSLGLYWAADADIFAAELAGMAALAGLAGFAVWVGK
jgi:hypothetical protein